MNHGLRGVSSAVLLGVVLVACGAATEEDASSVPASSAVFGRSRAAVTSATPETLSLDLLGDTARVFPADRLPLNGDADFIDNQDPNLLVQQNNTEVFVTYMSTHADLNSTLAYFTYPDGSPPTMAPTLTQAHVIFASSQGLTAGTRASLGVFNAGTRIGLVLLPGAGTSNPPSLSGSRYYSLASLNADGTHFTSKYHKAEQRRIIGIEDLPIPSSTYDLNDLIISISSTPKEKPRKMTICRYSFPNLSTGWQFHDWQAADCSAGLPSADAIALDSPLTYNGDPRQQASCTIQTGGHYYPGAGYTYAGSYYAPGTTWGTVACAFLLPNETTDIRTCSYAWPTVGTGWRTRNWLASDCPQGLPEQGSWAIGGGQNNAGTSGQVVCNPTSGHHYNHPYVDGANGAVVKCMYVKPTSNNDNITICQYGWPHTPENFVTGWRSHVWVASDCSNGLPKPGAKSIVQAQNGNGTRGIGQCTDSTGAHYNHPYVSGATSGAVTCLYVNP